MGWGANTLKSWKVGHDVEKVENPCPNVILPGWYSLHQNTFRYFPKHSLEGLRLVSIKLLNPNSRLPIKTHSLVLIIESEHFNSPSPVPPVVDQQLVLL